MRSPRDMLRLYAYKLTSDEVQSGFGRTGKYFASEYSGVRPDILVIAKGIANGFPLSGVVTRKELTDKMPKVSFNHNGVIGSLTRYRAHWAEHTQEMLSHVQLELNALIS